MRTINKIMDAVRFGKAVAYLAVNWSAYHFDKILGWNGSDYYTVKLYVEACIDMITCGERLGIDMSSTKKIFIEKMASVGVKGSK